MAATVFMLGAGVAWWVSNTSITLRQSHRLNSENYAGIPTANSEQSYTQSWGDYVPVYSNKFSNVQEAAITRDPNVMEAHRYLNSIWVTQSDPSINPFYRDYKRPVPAQTSEIVG